MSLSGLIMITNNNYSTINKTENDYPISPEGLNNIKIWNMEYCNNMYIMYFGDYNIGIEIKK